MRLTTEREELERLAFAKKAAAAFVADSRLATFSSNGPVRGEYFALRWGLGEDCVLVFKISEDAPIVNYQQLARKQ